MNPRSSESAAHNIVHRIRSIGKAIKTFREYCIIDERLSKRVARDYKNIARRLLESCDGVLSRKSIRAYLSLYLNKAPKTYNNQLDGLRAFIGRFLGFPVLIHGFKKAYVDYYDYEIELPNKRQLQLGFKALTDDRERSIYLGYASSGLRRSELLRMVFDDVDFALRCFRPKHFTRTKKAGVTFYNEKCECYLNRYLISRGDNNPRVFRIDNNTFGEMWKRVSKSAGYKITPQVLRKWHSTALGELGVPDRYVDIFQGRAPRSVLAKFYTGKELLRLKRIYDKADLRILS